MTLKKVYRITVQVPTSELTPFTTALVQSNLLELPGSYRDVYFCVKGIEHFTPLAGATPNQGEIGTPEKVESTQVAFAIPHEQDSLDAILAEITRSHPWERPVVFIDESFIPVE